MGWGSTAAPSCTAWTGPPSRCGLVMLLPRYHLPCSLGSVVGKDRDTALWYTGQARPWENMAGEWAAALGEAGDGQGPRADMCQGGFQSNCEMLLAPRGPRVFSSPPCCSCNRLWGGRWFPPCPAQLSNSPQTARKKQPPMAFGESSETILFPHLVPHGGDRCLIRRWQQVAAWGHLFLGLSRFAWALLSHPSPPLCRNRSTSTVLTPSTC